MPSETMTAALSRLFGRLSMSRTWSAEEIFTTIENVLRTLDLVVERGRDVRLEPDDAARLAKLIRAAETAAWNAGRNEVLEQAAADLRARAAELRNSADETGSALELAGAGVFFAAAEAVLALRHPDHGETRG